MMMSEEKRSVDTGGGASIRGDVDVTGGDFVGRDQYRLTVGDGILARTLGLAAHEWSGPHQLPADIADFTGRSSDTDKALAYLGAHTGHMAILNIVGMGGIGKTALAIHVAHSLVDRYPDAQLYLDLQGQSGSPRRPADMLADLLFALGYDKSRIPDGPDESSTIEGRASLYRSALSGKKILVLLDDAHSATQVRPLLPGGPDTAILITSRKRISLPGLQRLVLEQMSRAEARELLFTLAPRLVSDFATTDHIAALCGQLPLALRIAGSSLALSEDWTATDYAELLENERTRLAVLNQEDLDVETTLALSYERLGQEAPRLQELWRLLGLFPQGSFSARLVTGVWGVAKLKAKTYLSSLLQRCLLSYEPQTGRYRLHDLLVLFARSRLQSDTSLAQRLSAARRYVRNYTNFAREGLRESGAGPAYHASLYAEKSGLLRACVLASELQDWQDILQLWQLIGDMLWHRASWREYIDLVAQATEAARELESAEMLVMTLNQWARAEFEIGEFDRSEALHLEALQVTQTIPNAYETALAQIGLGRIHHIRREYEQGREHFEQAFEVVSSQEFGSGDRATLRCRVHNYLGSAYRKLGDLQRAQQEYLSAIQLAKELDDPVSLVAPLRNLGKQRMDLGQLDEAETLFEECLQICQQWKKEDFIAGLQYLMAQIAAKRGSRDRALTLAEESLATFTRLGMEWQIAGPRALVQELKERSE